MIQHRPNGRDHEVPPPISKTDNTMSHIAPTRSVARLLPVALLAALVVLPAPVSAQQQPLPDEVRTWLERDQVRRWRALVNEGDSIFHAGSCVRCHGTGGLGTQRGPDLTDATWSRSDGGLEGIRRTIFWGVRPHELTDGYPFPMNPAGSMRLDPTHYDALAAYVWTLANPTG